MARSLLKGADVPRAAMSASEGQAPQDGRAKPPVFKWTDRQARGVQVLLCSACTQYLPRPPGQPLLHWKPCAKRLKGSCRAPPWALRRVCPVPPAPLLLPRCRWHLEYFPHCT